MSICEENMRELYEASWGWDERKKLQELTHMAARFLILSNEANEINNCRYQKCPKIRLTSSCLQALNNIVQRLSRPVRYLQLVSSTNAK